MAQNDKKIEKVVKAEAPKAAAPAAEKKAEVKAEVKAEAKKPAAKKPAAKKAAAKKPAAKKPAAKKAPAKKPAAKKTAAKKAPAKKSEKKAELTYEVLFSAFEKKFKGTAVDKNADVSVEVFVYGAFEGKFYLKANEDKKGVLAIKPYDYQNADVAVRASTETVEKISAGKLSIVDAISSGAVEVSGDLTKAFQLKNLAK